MESSGLEKLDRGIENGHGRSSVNAEETLQQQGMVVIYELYLRQVAGK